jgi:hypothetical protein
MDEIRNGPAIKRTLVFMILAFVTAGLLQLMIFLGFISDTGNNSTDLPAKASNIN